MSASDSDEEYASAEELDLEAEEEALDALSAKLATCETGERGEKGEGEKSITPPADAPENSLGSSSSAQRDDNPSEEKSQAEVAEAEEEEPVDAKEKEVEQSDAADPTVAEGISVSEEVPESEKEKTEGVKEDSSTPDVVTSQPVVSEPVAPKPAEPQAAASSGGWGSWSSWGMSIAASVMQQDQPAEEPTKTTDAAGEESSAADAIAKATSAAASGLLGMFGGASAETAPSDDTEKPAEGQEGAAASAAGGSLLGMFGGISGLSATLQEKGEALMTGGLDTLEMIGKRTVQVLTEDDPGFRGTRKRLAGRQQRPNLSEMLHEARTHAETTSQEPASATTPRELGYNDFFEEYHGMVHLEALELLSRQCSSMVAGMMADAEPAVARTSKQFAEKFSTSREEAEQIEEDEETLFDGDKCLLALQGSIDGLQLQVPLHNLPKMIQACAERCKSLETEQEAKAIHELAVRSLAQLTAASMEVFHKTAELLMVPSTEGSEDGGAVANTKCQACFDFTQQVCEQLAFLSNSFVNGLNSCDSSDKDNISALVTSVFLEAANSASFTRDGCDFLLPSVQVLYLSRTQS